MVQMVQQSGKMIEQYQRTWYPNCRGLVSLSILSNADNLLVSIVHSNALKEVRWQAGGKPSTAFDGRQEVCCKPEPAWFVFSSSVVRETQPEWSQREPWRSLRVTQPASGRSRRKLIRGWNTPAAHLTHALSSMTEWPNSLSVLYNTWYALFIHSSSQKHCSVVGRKQISQ